MVGQGTPGRRHTARATSTPGSDHTDPGEHRHDRLVAWLRATPRSAYRLRGVTPFTWYCAEARTAGLEGARQQPPGAASVRLVRLAETLRQHRLLHRDP